MGASCNWSFSFLVASFRAPRIGSIQPPRRISSPRSFAAYSIIAVVRRCGELSCPVLPLCQAERPLSQGVDLLDGWGAPRGILPARGAHALPKVFLRFNPY